MNYVSFFLFGAIVGSFLNVLVLRLGTGKSISSGRSMCFACGRTLGWKELIPIVSYLIQRGHCRFCGSLISLQYLAVELLTALGFVAISTKDLNILALILALAIFSLAMAICVYDLRHKIVPDLLVYPFIFLCIIYFAQRGGFSLGILEIMAGPIAASFLAFFWLVSGGRWMGLGDAKIALGMGFFLTARGTLESFVIAFWAGAIVGIALLLISRRLITIKSEIPFAPFLLGSMFLVFMVPIPLPFL